MANRKLVNDNGNLFDKKIHLGSGYIIIGSGADEEKIHIEDICIRSSDMRNQILDKCDSNDK